MLGFEPINSLKTLRKFSIGILNLEIDLFSDLQSLLCLDLGFILFLGDNFFCLLGIFFLYLDLFHELLSFNGAFLQLRLKIFQLDLHFSDLLVGSDQFVKSSL